MEVLGLQDLPTVVPEVGEETYDKGAEILRNFFKQELPQFNVAELDPLGKQIIECCMDDGTLEQYNAFIPGGV